MESDADEEIETVIITGDYGDFSAIAENQLAIVHTSEHLGLQSPKDVEHTLSSQGKAKYYKQTYRTAWEEMPDFKGWLRGVPDQPTRAFCTFCQKSLHAHRLSLLKHTCTMRHQKAAQLHQSRRTSKNAAHSENDHSEVIESVSDEAVDMDDDELVDATPEGEQEEDDDEDIATIQIDGFPANIKISQVANAPANPSTAPISTQVVDTCIGKTINGLQVSLYKLVDGRWIFINEGTTNSEGRVWQFVDRNDFSIGRYKLHFDVDRYFESKNQDSMFPFIEIVFNCPSVMDTYHIPLLLSPYGYSTHRSV